MLGARRGFVFSLDSFVAFSLILIAVQSLVVISSAPSGYYHSLAQANFIAQDTVETLSHARYGNGKDLFSGGASAAINGRKNDARNLILATNDLVPAPFSYAYDYYSFEQDRWIMIYNASKEECPGGSPVGHSLRFCNVSFHRVQASASMFVGLYADPIEPGDSPNCNVACTGYVPGSGASSPPECVKVTCDNQRSNRFEPGDFRLGILRLRVWG